MGWDVGTLATLWQAFDLDKPVQVAGVETDPIILQWVVQMITFVTIPATIAMAVAVFWKQIGRLLPRNRFHDLHQDIRDIRVHLLDTSDPLLDDRPVVTTEIEELALTLRHRLDSLGVRCPPLEAMTWIRWLPQLAAWAATKDIRAARRHAPARPEVPGGEA